VEAADEGVGVLLWLLQWRWCQDGTVPPDRKRNVGEDGDDRGDDDGEDGDIGEHGKDGDDRGDDGDVGEKDDGDDDDDDEGDGGDEVGENVDVWERIVVGFVDSDGDVVRETQEIVDFFE
jgi:hypothetical protein